MLCGPLGIGRHVPGGPPPSGTEELVDLEHAAVGQTSRYSGLRSTDTLPVGEVAVGDGGLVRYPARCGSRPWRRPGQRRPRTSCSTPGPVQCRGLENRRRPAPSPRRCCPAPARSSRPRRLREFGGALRAVCGGGSRCPRLARWGRQINGSTTNCPPRQRERCRPGPAPEWRPPSLDLPQPWCRATTPPTSTARQEQHPQHSEHGGASVARRRRGAGAAANRERGPTTWGRCLPARRFRGRPWDPRGGGRVQRLWGQRLWRSATPGSAGPGVRGGPAGREQDDRHRPRTESFSPAAPGGPAPGQAAGAGRGGRRRHLGHGRPVTGLRCQHLQQQRGQRSGVPGGGINWPEATRCRTGPWGWCRDRTAASPPGAGVQRRAEGEDISGESRRPAACHLGREVGGRSRHHPGRGQRDVAGGMRDTEVGEHGGAVLGDQHVARLDVAVHDAGACAASSAAAMSAPIVPPRAMEASRARGRVGQAAGRHELHDQAGPVAVVDDVVDSHRMRMVQPGGDPSLPDRPLTCQQAVGVGQPGSVRSSLTATGRASRSSPPSQTTPMPPAAIRSTRR